MKTVKDRQYSFEHTRKRLKERYDININMEQYDQICQKVIDQKDVELIMIENQLNDVQYTYDLHFLHRDDIRVVWSDARRCITTVLPLGRLID